MPNQFEPLPILDLSPLFGGAGERDETIHQLGETLAREGAVIATGLPKAEDVDSRAHALGRFYELPYEERLAVATRRLIKERRQVYRGYVNSFDYNWSYNEFFDIGPDFDHAPQESKGLEVFAEKNLWPAREPFPGWRQEMQTYFQQMNATGAVVLEALARHLNLPGDALAPRFERANSTLRLLNYPEKPKDFEIKNRAQVEAMDDATPLIAGRHTDGAALSILWQRDPGLQTETPEGEWRRAPIVENAVSIHLGTVLEFLTNGRLRATHHRVTDSGQPRRSIGFFYEPALNASLEPLLPPINGVEIDNPDATYGQHLLRRFKSYGGYEFLDETAA